ncbi:pseudouridine synthase [Marinagarivorans algicola]|uniref:pseudouridine synthase n=1 Tax=Marinagarivorans algicola TaxID=1513270 RepID=UPI0009EC7D3B|nr:pseudouridine synthase [Marinagarivorans algicola]
MTRILTAPPLIPLTAKAAASIPLTILFEDSKYVAVDKPAGLLVHKSDIDKHETQFLLQQLRDQIGCYLYPIHRLDKPTSGVIIFGKTPEAVAALKKQMESNTAVKEYLLVCRGYCPEQGVINHALKPVSDFKRKRDKLASQSATQKPPQEAVTEFKRLAKIEVAAQIDRYPQSRFSLVSAQLRTGRKHQIRRHFKHLSHPIIGCPKYGKSTYNHYFAQQLLVPRLLLHAYRLSFCHPMSGANLDIVAQPSGSFAALLRRFCWDSALTVPRD